MFKTTQIISSTMLIRNFPAYSKYLREMPQALLITQKNGEHLVLVNASIFEGMLADQYEKYDPQAENNYRFL